MSREYIDLVFAPPPDDPRKGVTGPLIEVEFPEGRGVRVGEWITREDGTQALRIRPADFDAAT